MSTNDFPFARPTTLKKSSRWKPARNGLLGLLALCMLWLCSCTPPLLVRHRSSAPRVIDVYINYKLRCRVAPGESCSLDLPPGRYYFYALVPGMKQYAWASKGNPVPFAVDKGTVIDLHDPKPKPYRLPSKKPTNP
ncbi:MAG: hypothetical protein EP343_27935 [Deltaproteobacteria bacterium]|nr:MAG: hypothetical protein EP343_27935 [Deltaproteobacteria bacterium]